MVVWEVLRYIYTSCMCMMHEQVQKVTMFVLYTVQCQNCSLLSSLYSSQALVGAKY